VCVAPSRNANFEIGFLQKRGDAIFMAFGIFSNSISIKFLEINNRIDIEIGLF